MFCGVQEIGVKSAKGSLLLGLGILWLFGIAAGHWVLTKYEISPGEVEAAPAQWPSGSQVPRRQGHATLVMLAHPGCACTRASLSELALIMSRAQDRATAHVLFFKPTAFPESWAKGDLWERAAAIPGVAVRVDEAGVEGARFGAATSGQVVLYDAADRLIFHGGITGSRGHSGDNAGRDAVLDLLTTGNAETRSTFVFGCALRDSR